jgi:quinol monooxygenase YgiN
MQGGTVTVVINYQAQPGQGETARRELAALIDKVVASEPDCRGIQLLVDEDDDARFLLYERWTGRAAYTGPHMQTAHIQEFITKAPSFMAGPPAITYWQLTHDVLTST